MTATGLFEKLWKDYAAMNPQAGAIHAALEARGERVVNDHVAFRTFDLPRVSVQVLARPFLDAGYRDAGKGYEFPAKRLFARHFEPPVPGMPKVFISELKTGDFSPSLQEIVRGLVEQVPEALTETEDFLISGTAWKPVSRQVYQDLLKESEYAAWMSAFGFRVNHFTVFFNSLTSFRDLSELNAFIKSLGYGLNASGGEIKGSPAVLLEQSSTLAQPVEVVFDDRKEKIPACYYEFARRYKTADGRLFEGFLPESADKIFESTDFRKPQD